MKGLARRYCTVPRCAVLAASIVCLSYFVFAETSFTAYEDVREVLASLGDAIPPELKSSGVTTPRQAWPGWVAGHDREIRTRLQRGDDDTVVHWLLFGTSFTREPSALLESSVNTAKFRQLTSRRIKDLISVLALADQDERNVFVRRLLQSEGYGFKTAEERTQIERRLQSEVDRVVAERQQYQLRLAEALRSSDIAEKVTGESRLFRDRGLSLDTSIMPGFSIEQALATMRNQKLIPPNGIRRVAVIGPGLDFADKNSGYDFYPVQTLQPFTTIDSLVRLGLAAPAEIELTTLDISPRVNDHIKLVQDRAKMGVPYVLRLPIELGSPWTPALVLYWKTIGDRIGAEKQLPKPPPIGKDLELRGIEVRPQIAARVTPADFNAVTQKWTGPPFDLVIATNVLVYYDKLDQSLAFAGIEAMLRPGGYFLTNNAIVELPTSHLRSVGGLIVQYTIGQPSTDHVVWYRRNP